MMQYFNWNRVATIFVQDDTSTSVSHSRSGQSNEITVARTNTFHCIMGLSRILLNMMDEIFNVLYRVIRLKITQNPCQKYATGRRLTEWLLTTMSVKLLRILWNWGQLVRAPTLQRWWLKSSCTVVIQISHGTNLKIDCILSKGADIYFSFFQKQLYCLIYSRTQVKHHLPRKMWHM